MKRGISGTAIRSSLIVLAVLLVPLVAAPVQAQPAADDQYEGRTGVGYDAADDALTASEAFDDTEANTSEESAPSPAEGPPAPSEPGIATAGGIAEAATSGPEEGIALDSLPETGGISPLLLGVLLVAAGVLIRYVAR
jgi:hypothetical protein